MTEWLNIALPKGRLGEKAYRLLETAGYPCAEIMGESRKLIFEDEIHGLRYFWVKPADVGVYAERGSADLGVVGSDILRESEPDIYELADLGIGKCRMAVAEYAERMPVNTRRLRVATKYPHTAMRYYSRVGRDIDLIRLNGSIELAPLLGLSDVIVDIVETGRTLQENGLSAFETIEDVSARLIANKVSYKFAYDRISVLVRNLEAAVKTGG